MRQLVIIDVGGQRDVAFNGRAVTFRRFRIYRRVHTQRWRIASFIIFKELTL